MLLVFKVSLAINKTVYIQCDTRCTERLPLPSAGVFLQPTNSFCMLCYSDMLPLTYPSPSGQVGTTKKKNKSKARIFGSPERFFCLVMVEAALQRALFMFKLMTGKLEAH